MKYVYIGRFQPFHKGHKAIVDLTVKMMKPEDTFTVIIGSSDQQETERNPLSYIQRIEMLKRELKEYPFIQIEHINDSPYNYDYWVRTLCTMFIGQAIFYMNSNSLKDVCIVGMENVEEYVEHINSFFRGDTGIQYHKFTEEDTGVSVHGSAIRQLVKKETESGDFELSPTFYDDIKDMVSDKVLDYLKWVDFQNIIWKAYDYSAKYAKTTGCKYNSCFVTVDNIVYDRVSDRVLLIKRGDNGKYAIPGGFAEPYMSARENALRELQEETNISKQDLIEAHVDMDVSGVIIDAPYRDPRSSSKCNFVSIVYVWSQRDFSSYHFGELMKKAVAGDDAVNLVWLSRQDIEDTPAWFLHADHKKILCKLLNWNYFLA